MSILNPAPQWNPPRSRHVTLWHGCTTQDRDAIELNGIDLTVCRVDTDFGRGFYTTTIERQARHWAWVRCCDPKVANKAGIRPVILRFRVDRHKLAELPFIAFVLGQFGNKDYWSLVQHCRRDTPAAINDHKGPTHDGGYRWYDVAYGPVAAFWEQRVAMVDSDQLSFHTSRAAQLLDGLIRSGKRKDYEWFIIN